MPSEYRPTTVTSGDVRARISGDVVNVSGANITATANISGQVVQISGQVVDISGSVVRVSGMIEAVAALTLDNIDPTGLQARTVRSFLHGFDSATTEWNRLQTFEPATVNPESVLGTGLRAFDVGPQEARRLEVTGSGQPALAVGSLSGQYVVVSGTVIANVSGSTVSVSGGGAIRVAIFDGNQDPSVMAALRDVSADNTPIGQGLDVRGYRFQFDGDWAGASSSWWAQRAFSQDVMSGTFTQAAGVMGRDPGSTLARAIETIASGEPILKVGHASGTRLISVSSQLISSGGQTYTGAALTFALGKYTAFALYNTVTRSNASGQTVETQMQFSDDAGVNWYDLVDGPFGALLYEGVQVGSFGTLRDVQTGKVAGPNVRVFVRTSGSTLNGSNNFTLSSFAMLLNN